MARTMITAHSGCEGTSENSLESVQAGIRAGADCVEVDVRLDASGNLWLTHNEVERFTGLVSLKEAMAAARDAGVGINCDLKEEKALYPVLDLADREGLDRHLLILSGSVDIPLVRRDPSISRRAQIYANSEVIARYLSPDIGDDRAAHTAFLTEQAADTAQLLRDIGAAALNAPHWFTTDSMIAAMKAWGIALSLWTVNDEEHLRRLLSAGVMNITTRTPATALQLRDQAIAK